MTQRERRDGDPRREFVPATQLDPPESNDSLPDFCDSRWTDFNPSLPEVFCKSQNLIAAIAKSEHCIDDFEIIEMLGEGTFGKVFLARQVSLDREIALKVTANLGNEGRTMARLEHRHIVQVYSETVDPELDLRFLCMKFVAGTTLRQVLHDLRRLEKPDGAAILSIINHRSCRPVTLDPTLLRERARLTDCELAEAVCWIGSRLAEALAYAHRRDVLHLDIKPANVIIDQYGQPMLTDFSVSSPSNSLNRGAAILGGTMGYMAPEHQAALMRDTPDPSNAIDERSDIFSLGALLMDLVLAEGHSEIRPGPNHPPQTSTDPDHFQVGNRDLEYVSAMFRRHDTPKSLARVITRCLQPSVENRYAEADQLAHALENVFDMLRVARKMPAGSRLVSYVSRWPIRSILVLTVVPNLTASVVNLAYNSIVLMQELTPQQQTAFFWMVIWYNVVVVSVLAILVYRALIPVARGWWNLQQNDIAPTTRSDYDEVRKRVLKLPRWATILNTIGWMPFVLVIPLGMELMAGPIQKVVLLQIALAFFVTGLIAVVYNYYVVTFVVLRGMYPRLWDDGERIHEQARLELAAIPSRNRTYQVIAGFTPLWAAAILVVVGPNQFTPQSFNQFRIVVGVLIAGGLAAFWLAMTLTVVLNEYVTVLTASRRST